MKHISVMIKPASALCNLRCKYCFYANVSSLREVRSYGKMKPEVTEKMIDNIFIDLEDGDELTFAFQGGEPTLAGLSYFQHFVSYVKQQEKVVTVHYALQTNGMLINEIWSQFLLKNDFLVGLSIDGHPAIHNQNRLDHRQRGTFQKVLETKHLFDDYQIEYNILCVLTEQLSFEAQKVYDFIVSEEVNYIQFIPCLDDLDAVERGEYALTPESFANFYLTLLQLWLSDLKKGKYRSIKLFDDIINLLVRQQLTACGIMGNCRVQYVIEADGSVYPCDFFVLDEYRMGNIQENTLREIFEAPITSSFLCSKNNLPEKCLTCPFKDICNGGCKRMNDAMYINKQTNFCGNKKLLEGFIPEMPEILSLLQGVKV